MSDDEIVHDWESDCYVLHIANTNLREERDRLRTENEKLASLSAKASQELSLLRAALKPFAYYASQIPDDVSDTASASGTVGDLRAAAAALKETGDE